MSAAEMAHVRAELDRAITAAETPEELDALIDVIVAVLAPRTGPQLGLALERLGRYPRPA